MLTFHSGNFRQLAVFLEVEPDEVAEITLKSVERIRKKKGRRRERVIFRLSENMVYTLSTGDAKIGLAYLFDAEDMKDRGVLFLDSLYGKEKTCETAYHFSPYPTPLRAVSAACFYKGYFHILFQFNPFSETEQTMYWGHAASRDMVHWHELPILLEPQKELVRTRHRTGGAYSGCAEVLEDRVRLYLTRLIGDRKTGQTLRAYQSVLESRDLLHISPEKTILAESPPKADLEFQSPVITAIKGRKQMVLGGSIGGRGAVFLYGTDGKTWQYKTSLYVCKHPRVNKITKPDFFAIGRTHVLCAGLSGFRDADGTMSPLYWFCGSVREGKLRVRNRGRMDFGGDFYAMSTFLHAGRRILFATTACPDATEVNPSLVLPREVFWKHGRLCLKPIAEVYSLLGDVLYRGRGEKMPVILESAAFYVRISFRATTAFRLLLGRNKEQTLFLIGNADTCAFVLEYPSGEKQVYDAAVAAETIEIFVDCGMVEAFINGGTAAGTKRFFSDAPVFSAEFQDAEKVETVEVRKVMPCNFPFLAKKY